MSDRIAVMHDGRVVQCGVPEEVYERPEEPFVAGFIGISNLMEGTVVDGDSVRIANGEVIPAPLPEGLSPGDTVQISVRPEKIALEEVEDGMVSLKGTIEQRIYQGITTQVTVSLGEGARLVALEQQTYGAEADSRWEPGTEVTVGWHPEHCLVLREAEAASSPPRRFQPGRQRLPLES
jgi:spermidine/putrescine transport system ATP-binding protein